MHYTRKCFAVVVFLALSITCYVFLYSHASINAVKKFNIKQLQVEKNYQRFPSIQRKRSESDSIILTNLRKGRSLTNTTYNRLGNAFIPYREDKGSPQKSVKENSTLSKTHNSKMHRDGFLRNYSISSNPIEDKNTHDTTNNVSLPFNSIQQKTPCRIILNQSSLATARKKFSDSTGSVLFYVNIDADGMFNSFTNQEQDKLRHWEYVLKKEQYLVQLPDDFNLVTYFLIPNDNEEFVLNLKVFYNDSNCEENFPEALRQVKFSLWNNLFYNASDSFLCHRYFEDQNLRKFLYWITTIWVGYDLTCSEMLFKDDKLQIYEHIVEKDVLPYFVSWVTFYLSLQFIWTFALLDLNRYSVTSHTTENESLSFYRKNDRPYGIKRFISKLLYMECPCISEPEKANEPPTSKSQKTNEPIELQSIDTPPTSKSQKTKESMKSPPTSEHGETDRYCIHPVNRLLLLTWGFILLPFGFYRTYGRYLLNAKFFKSYSEVIKPSEPVYNWISSDTMAVTIDTLTAVLVPLFFVFRGNHLYQTFINHKFQSQKEQENVIPNDGKDKQATQHVTYRYSDLRNKRQKNQGGNETNERTPLVNSLQYSDYRTHEKIKGVTNSKVSDKTQQTQDKTDEKATQHVTNSTVSDRFVNLLYDMFHNLYFMVTCKCCKQDKCCRCLFCFKCCRCSEEYWECDENAGCCSHILCSGLTNFGCFFINLVCCLIPIIPFICSQLRTCPCECDSCLESCKCSECCDHFNCCKCCNVSICFIATLICLRPIISTFTFIFRSFTYFVFVALLIRIHIMRYALIVVSILFYILNYMMEIINMNVDILNHIISLEIKPLESTKTTSNNNDSVEKKVREEIFDNVYNELSFVKRKLYFLCLKILIVALYLIITIIMFTKNRESLIGINFKDNLEVLFFIIGPYAVTFVLKTYKGDYLSEENKIEIKDIYDRKNNTTVLKAYSLQTDTIGEKETTTLIDL